MYKLYSFFVIASIISVASSCERDKPTEPILEMPTYTETGANTFAYKVDGRVVVARNELHTTPHIVGNRAKSSDSAIGNIFFCEGRVYKKNFYEVVYFGISNVNDTGRYDLMLRDESNYNQGQYRYGENDIANHKYITNTTHSGQVHVTKFDTANKIISGKFYFKGEYTFGEGTKTITEGQFDMIYRQN